MIVLIRVDANLLIGTGHVMRCAALGARLSMGSGVHFVCVDCPDGLRYWLIRHGYRLTNLPGSAIGNWEDDLHATREIALDLGPIDLLIVDHYGLGKLWERGMRPYTKRILVIDDLANRDHDCDFLLDQNLHKDSQDRYQLRVPLGTRQFLGPQYALLRIEFDDYRLDRTRDGTVKRLLVFFGGTDHGNQTIKVINALRALGSRSPQCVIVLGPAHPNRDAIQQRAVGMVNLTILDTTDQMSLLIAQADLGIGTCGVAAWERCALGLPTLVTTTAENQREDAEILHKLGAVEHLGNAHEVSAKVWEAALQRVMDDPQLLRTMASSARKIMLNRRSALAELEKALLDGLR